MSILIDDAGLEERILAERRAQGIDHHDEVWEGVYVVSPIPNNEHQDLVGNLVMFLKLVIQKPGLGKVYPGVNISDRRDDWRQNYRVPDVAVFLTDCSAQDCGTHWLGGPTFACEILSDKDRTREKIPFYAKVGTQELLLIDRDPWTLELYRWRDGELELAGGCDQASEAALPSATLPLTFQLLAAEPRCLVRMVALDGQTCD